MDRNEVLPVERSLTRKRLLIVGTSARDTDQRSEYLRMRGYEVDCASTADAALTLSRTRNYHIIVLTLDCEGSIAQLAQKLRRLNPTGTVTCLADCKKPIPPLPGYSMLWTGEPLEYFAARVEALSVA